MASSTNSSTSTHPTRYMTKQGLARHVPCILVFAFGVAVWLGFLVLPRANPWMMGEAALLRLIIVNGVMLAGSIAAIAVSAIGWLQLRSRWYLFASLPCLSYVIMMIASIYQSYST